MKHGLTESYTSEVDSFLFGTRQGDGWSTPSWSSLSDLIRRVMEQQAQGINITEPDRSTVNRILDVFVDYVHEVLTNEGLKRFHSQPQTSIPKYTNIYE